MKQKSTKSKKSKGSGFRCGTCGKWHDELLTDMAFNLPDAVWELEYLERYQRSRHNADFCTLDKSRYFIRCVLPVRFTYREGFFGWGVWIEVKKKDHDRYLKAFRNGAKSVKPFTGIVANKFKKYRNTVGLTVSVRLSDEHRPLVTLEPGQRHKLVREQAEGIGAERHHELVAPHF